MIILNIKTNKHPRKNKIMNLKMKKRKKIQKKSKQIQIKMKKKFKKLNKRV